MAYSNLTIARKGSFPSPKVYSSKEKYHLLYKLFVFNGTKTVTLQP